MGLLVSQSSVRIENGDDFYGNEIILVSGRVSLESQNAKFVMFTTENAKTITYPEKLILASHQNKNRRS